MIRRCQPASFRLFCTVALCALLVLTTQGCVRQRESFADLTLTHEVSPQSPTVGPVTIMLTLADASGKPVTPARVTLEGNMSHAGMVPAFAEATEVEPGRYRATMQLSMAGDWVVLVHLILPDGRALERQFEIKGVAPA
jgi:hypothetical protein